MRYLLPALCATLLMPTLAGARPVVIVAELYPPATFMKGGEAAGIDVDIVRTILDRLGVQYEIRLLPWARSWAMLQTGAADIGLHVSYNDERSRFVTWPKNWVWRADFVFMTNQATKAAYDIRSYDDVRRSGLAVGIVNGDSYHQTFWDAFPSPRRGEQKYDPQLEAAVDAATNLKKLAVNHIQLFPTPLLVGNYMTRNGEYEGVTRYDWVLFSKPYPSAFSRLSTYSDAKYPNIQALMQAYDAELEKLKSRPAEYLKFFQRYD